MDLSACYSKYLKEKNLENPGKTLSFVSQKEMVELTGKENILGVYESKRDTVKLNKQLNRDMKHIMSTAQHEYLHWLSQKRNAEGKPDGLSGIKTLDEAYPAYNVAMNEGITEMLAVDQMKQYFPDYETRSYQLEVKAMQEFLLQLEYSLPKYGADGEFGSETETALKKFQKKAGIKQDGIYGSVTHQALMDAVADDDEGKGRPDSDHRGGGKREIRAVEPLGPCAPEEAP